MFGSAQLAADEQIEETFLSVGTRFLIFPQVPHLANYGTPETVWISTPPERLRAGPSDHRIYARDPLLHKEPYEYPSLPPYVGDVHPPAEAGFEGHFDTVPIQSRQFLAAHAFACASRVLDVWESYLGHPIVWHFAETYERLEIIPCLEWDNAQSGYGYLELGLDIGTNGGSNPYALNFDVIAHEIGHSILFSQVGFPSAFQPGGHFTPFHEANADLISLLSFMHFDSGLDRLLRHCDGNLLVLNELNRIAELSGDRQIRLASNSRRFSEVSAEDHDQSRPFTGAVFDTLVDSYHAILVREGLADERLMNIDVKGIDSETLHRVSKFTTSAYRARPLLFKSALVQARDEVAMALAQSWRGINADDLAFDTCSIALIDAGHRIDPALARRLEINLAWRELL
jgi:hypothetical protein